MTELLPHVENQLRAQNRRQRAYEEGVYELDDDEGFLCDDCDWQGLTAGMNDDWTEADDLDAEPICLCPECGGAAETHQTEAEMLDNLRQFVNAPITREEADDA